MNEASVKENVAVGRVTQVLGAVVDVQFQDEKSLPPILNATPVPGAVPGYTIAVPQGFYAVTYVDGDFDSRTIVYSVGIGEQVRPCHFQPARHQPPAVAREGDCQHRRARASNSPLEYHAVW